MHRCVNKFTGVGPEGPISCSDRVNKIEGLLWQIDAEMAFKMSQAEDHFGIYWGRSICETSELSFKLFQGCALDAETID